MGQLTEGERNTFEKLLNTPPEDYEMLVKANSPIVAVIDSCRRIYNS